MPSKIVRYPEGGGAIIHFSHPRLSKRRNHPPKCFFCDTPSTHQCDYTVGNTTCNRYLCIEHRNFIAKGLDFCPEHLEQHRKALKESKDA